MSEENQSIQNKIHLKHSKPQIVPTFPAKDPKSDGLYPETFSTQGGYKFLEVRPLGYRKWWTEAIQNLYLRIFHITSYNWLMHMIITWHYPLTIGCPKFVHQSSGFNRFNMLAPPQRCRNWAPVQSPCSPIAARPAAAGLITIGSTIDFDLHKLGNTWGLRTPTTIGEISPLFRGTASPRAVSQISLLFCFWTCWGKGKKNNPTGFWTSFSQKCRCKSTMFWQTELWPLWSDPLRKSKVFHSVGYIFNLWNIYT